jgi:hypothetical protein
MTSDDKFFTYDALNLLHVDVDNVLSYVKFDEGIIVPFKINFNSDYWSAYTNQIYFCKPLTDMGYNIVEMTHHIWLVAIVDYLVGKIEYKAN